uniref:DUF6090 family protein n=1 Tax=Gelidibacter sp. TaxID=2018083 RepID=UPI00404AEF97
MIKLFRNIRKKLLEQGKTANYLKYAIGEIILVVIGILIALQINNWNEKRKASIEEKAILESLSQNLKLSKEQSESLISEEIKLKNLIILVLGIDNATSNNDLDEITDAIFADAVWNLNSDQPTFSAYNNLKNTNKLSLIRNKKINEKFTNLEFHQKRLEDILNDRLNVHQIRIDNILENDINFIPLLKSNIPTINIEKETPNNYKQVLEDKRIRNLIGMKLTFTQDVISYRENLDKEIKELIHLIGEEINSK